MKPAQGTFRHSRARGFTLVEILVATTIMGLVAAGAISFGIQSLNIYHYDAGRLLVNKDIRSFTQEMTSNAVYSNYFRIYPNFTSRSSTDDDGVTSDLSVRDGESGDFLVLFFDNTNTTTGVKTITRIIGYYRDPADPSDPASSGPVRKFDVTLNPAVDAASTTLASLLDTYAPTSGAHTNPTVVQLAQGLSNGSLFYDFKDRSVMIKGQIIETGNQMRRAVNTYNFTVSPRG